MCRNIKVLANFEPPATADEIHASALQFVRKLSGTSRPSKANEAAFQRAVEEVTAAARTLIASLHSSAPPRNREVERSRAQARNRRRFGPPEDDTSAASSMNGPAPRSPMDVPSASHPAARHP